MGKLKFLIFVFASCCLFLLWPQKAEAADADIVINEVMANPNTGGVEWIELFNNTLTDISLAGYTIEDGTVKPKDLELCNISANSYLVLEKGSGDCKFSFILNNDSDTIILKNLGSEIDKVIYGGSIENAPIPILGKSIARVPNGYDSNNDAIDFVIQNSPTPGAENPLPPANTAPITFNLISPENGSESISGQDINFSWEASVDPEEDEISYSLYLGCSNIFSQDDLVVSGQLETNYSHLTQKTCDQYFWQIIASDGSLETPSSENRSFTLSSPIVYPPEVLGLVNINNAIIRQVQVSRIIDGDTIEVTGLDGFPSIVRLLFVDTPEENQPFYQSSNNFTGQLLGQNIDLIISQKLSEQKDIYDRTLAVIVYQDKVFNTQLLEQGLASFYEIDNSALNFNAWFSILQQAQQARIGLWESAGKIILSELLPNPVGLDSEGEWVEIYNPTNDPVVLSRFLLDEYQIPDGLTIAPQGYYVFHRNITGVTLNNTEDSVQLSYPGGLIINKISYTSSKEGQSWALINGKWQWTTQITPADVNILGILEDAGGSNDEENQEIPINKDPVEIKTGEFRNFENYLVTVSGTVTETSGNTFYLDDGSGKAKIYIQSASGIDKPPMHKGDIFEVTGIVNLYRDTWRILPQKQDDIQLIEAVRKDVEVKVVSSKKATATTASAKKTSTSSNAKARAPTVTERGKEVASASDSAKVKSEKVITPWWIQLFKMLIGLAVALLILLLIRIFRTSKIKPLCGGFGDET